MRPERVGLCPLSRALIMLLAPAILFVLSSVAALTAPVASPNITYGGEYYSPITNKDICICDGQTACAPCQSLS
jgi:hypothetical protein